MSVSDDGKRALLGNFSQQIVLLDTSDPNEMIRILRTNLQDAGPTPLWNATFAAMTAMAHQSGRRVVLYCACPEEASAAMGALVLQGRGHLDARALQGGIEAWIAAGYASTLARRAPHVARDLEHEL